MKTLLVALLMVFGIVEEIDSARASTFTVQVDVGGDDEAKSIIGSYLRRELRSLSDVELVDTNSFLSISVVVLPIRLGQQNFGYAISCVVARPFGKGYWKVWRDLGKMSEEDVRVAQRATERFSEPLSHEVMTCATGLLQEQCSKIIAEFDTKWLEPQRALLRASKAREKDIKERQKDK